MYAAIVIMPKMLMPQIIQAVDSGDPLNISYLMDSSVYRFFYLLKHNIPSTSEMKVVQCLQEMSEGTGREVLFNLRYILFSLPY